MAISQEELDSRMAELESMDFTDAYKALNIDALLAGAFAHSVKMMRFVDTVYDSDKEHYYKLAEKNPKFRSRFITDNRIHVKLNAIKALAIIEAAKTDEQLNKNMDEAMDRAFSSILNVFSRRYIDYEDIVELILKDSSDDYLHDVFALYIYSCRRFNREPILADLGFKNFFSSVSGKEGAYMKPFVEAAREYNREMNAEHLVEQLKAGLGVNRGKVKKLADFALFFEDDSEDKAFFNTMWDMAQLAGIPMSMYENEELSKKDLSEICEVMIMDASIHQFDSRYSMLFFMLGAAFKSIAGFYKESTDLVEEYAGIIRENERDEKLRNDLSRSVSRNNELEMLVKDKQEKLNTLQMEAYRTKKALRDKEAEVQTERDRTRLLEKILEEEAAVSEEIKSSTEDFSAAKSAKCLVLGGTHKWQSEVTSVCPDYRCIEVEANNFDVKLIDNCEAVVMKTNFLNHSQYYKVIERAKKKNKKIVYCTNNINNMLAKITKMLNA